jgi:hypothetical protein
MRRRMRTSHRDPISSCDLLDVTLSDGRSLRRLDFFAGWLEHGRAINAAPYDFHPIAPKDVKPVDALTGQAGKRDADWYVSVVLYGEGSSSLLTTLVSGTLLRSSLSAATVTNFVLGHGWNDSIPFG